MKCPTKGYLRSLWNAGIIKQETEDVKGICNVCRMPVFVDHARSKDPCGSYGVVPCHLCA
jgi:hypothetical protein